MLTSYYYYIFLCIFDYIYKQNYLIELHMIINIINTT